jgi:diguanylate cyclase (GGDEF)-like protein
VLAAALGASAAASATGDFQPLKATKAKPNPALALIERGIAEMRIAPEASKRDAQDALKSLQRQPDADLEIRARLILCDYQSERDISAAEQQAAAIEQLLPNAHRQGLRAGLLDCRGVMAETAGNNAKAQEAYEEAVAVSTRAHDDEMLAQSLFSRGYLLGLQGEYAAGMSDLKRAKALFDRLNKPLHALTTLNSIAILYNRMGDYARAREIYGRALEAQRATGMRREEGVTLYNLGRADENLKQWDSARQAFTQSLALSRELNYPRGEAYALRGLAAVADAGGEPRLALETLDRAEALQRQTPDARLHAQIQLARGVALHQLHHLTESATVLEDALGVFAQADALGDLQATYSELAQVYAENGDWRRAYERQTQAKEASDRLLSNQLDQRFTELKVEFDTAAKEKENAVLLRENAVSQQALAQGRNVRALQAVVLVLVALLAVLLTMLAVFQRRSTLRMRSLAMTDELTSVPNRRAVLRRLEPLLRDDSTAPCSILIVDIDHFKKINDQLGHLVGDEVLKAFANGMRAAVVEPAFFGRLGGEEFLIVLPDTDLPRARSIAEHLRERICCLDTSLWFSDQRQITASFGCASSMGLGDTPSSMLKRADIALYAAKRGGRNCVRSEPGSAADVDLLTAQAR